MLKANKKQGIKHEQSTLWERVGNFVFCALSSDKKKFKKTML